MKTYSKITDDWFLRVKRSVGHVPEPEDQLQSVSVGCLPPGDEGGAGQVRRVPRHHRHLVHGLWNSERESCEII